MLTTLPPLPLPVETPTCDDCGSQRHTTKQHVDRLARLSRIDAQIHDDEAGLRALADALARWVDTSMEVVVTDAINRARLVRAEHRRQRDAVELDPRFTTTTEARAA